MIDKIIVGDRVARKSYNKDIAFRIDKITKVEGKNVYLLRGVNLRIIADAFEEDLEKVSDDYLGERDIELLENGDSNIEPIKEQRSNDIKILHLEGDSSFIPTCQAIYGSELGLNATCVHVPESQQESRVLELIEEHNPNILVLTGHDNILNSSGDLTDIDNYRNSKYYLAALKKVREQYPNKEELIIFVGGCKTYFEKMMEAGANFASSPFRVNIKLTDPIAIVHGIVNALLGEVSSSRNIVSYALTSYEGVGGVWRKKYRGR